MQICSDPLETIRCIGPRHNWRVKLPACYPTLQPYQPSGYVQNSEDHSKKTTTESLLIQRFRQKIELHQTPTSNDARQVLQRLTAIIQKHVPDFVLKDFTNTDLPEQTASRSTSLSTDGNEKKEKQSSFSLRRLFGGKKSPNEDNVSRDPSQYSQLSSASNLSSNSTDLDVQGENSSNRLSTKILGKHENNQRFSKVDDDRNSIVTHISVPGTSNSSEHRALDSPLRQIVSDTVQPIDLSTSISGLSAANRDYLGSSISKTSEESSVQTSDKKKQRRKNWIFQRLSRKLSKITSSQDLSSGSRSPAHLINQLHIADALASFEPTLTKESIQILMNKKKDSQNQGFIMRWLQAPVRCCRSCRTQRRLASAAQRSVNMAIKNLSLPL